VHVNAVGDDPVLAGHEVASKVRVQGFLIDATENFRNNRNGKADFG
jgi:hypothetical protein